MSFKTGLEAWYIPIPWIAKGSAAVFVFWLKFHSLRFLAVPWQWYHHLKICLSAERWDKSRSCLFVSWSKSAGLLSALCLFRQSSCLPWMGCVLVWLVSAFPGIVMRKSIDICSGVHELSFSSAFALLWSVVLIFVLVTKFCVLKGQWSCWPRRGLTCSSTVNSNVSARLPDTSGYRSCL